MSETSLKEMVRRYWYLHDRLIYETWTEHGSRKNTRMLFEKLNLEVKLRELVGQPVKKSIRDVKRRRRQRRAE